MRGKGDEEWGNVTLQGAQCRPSLSEERLWYSWQSLHYRLSSFQRLSLEADREVNGDGEG